MGLSVNIKYSILGSADEDFRSKGLGFKSCLDRC